MEQTKQKIKNEKTQAINILFAGNVKVYDGILLCLLSIIKRAAQNHPLNVFVFTMNLTRLKEDYTVVTDEQINCLQMVMQRYNRLSSVKKIDVSDLYESEFACCPNEGAYCSPYTLLRLFADKIPEIPDKILYLDADLMFNDDIMLLYETDITQYEYAAACDRYGKLLIKRDYINAGVLLLNMKKIRQTGLFVKARTLICTKKLVFADQSAIIRSTTAKKLLPQRFNNQKKLKKDTVVLHFSKRLFYLPYPHTENIKQWQIEKVHKKFKYTCFDDIYEEYLKDYKKGE